MQLHPIAGRLDRWQHLLSNAECGMRNAEQRTEEQRTRNARMCRSPLVHSIVLALRAVGHPMWEYDWEHDGDGATCVSRRSYSQSCSPLERVQPPPRIRAAFRHRAHPRHRGLSCRFSQLRNCSIEGSTAQRPIVGSTHRPVSGPLCSFAQLLSPPPQSPGREPGHAQTQHH